MEKRMDRHQDKDLLNSCLDTNLDMIRHVTGHSSDIVVRQLNVGKNKDVHLAIIYTDGLVNQMQLGEFIILPIVNELKEINLHHNPQVNTLSDLKQSILKSGDIKDLNFFDDLYPALLTGRAILLIDGFHQGLSVGVSEWKDRGISENAGETVIRGPREAFTETLQTNITQIRRKISDPNLWVENQKIGRISHTNLSIVYLNGIVDQTVLTELRKRLDQIDIDAILESGYIEEFIQETTYSPFPTVYSTERPDIVAAGILEGRVAILVDGTPFALLVPSLFTEFYQAASDYYQRADISTLLRFLRLICLFFALLGTSFFIAVTTFHQERIPTQLLISLVAQREGVPFPAVVEAIMLEIPFEILREAGVRMPRAVGNAVSVVGTLVVGTAAVEAGFVSAAMVIIVSITAISSFVIPAESMSISIRILRFIFMLLAGTFGIFGLATGLVVLVLHLCHLKSFGVPYFTPFGPFVLEDQKDTLFRFPHWGLLTRPKYIGSRNKKRATPIRRKE